MGQETVKRKVRYGGRTFSERQEEGQRITNLVQRNYDDAMTGDAKGPYDSPKSGQIVRAMGLLARAVLLVAEELHVANSRNSHGA